MEFNIKIFRLQDGKTFVAVCPELPGLAVEGFSKSEVKNKFMDALEGFVSSYDEHFEKIPVRGNGNTE